jgi:general secretion pathway protein D
VQALLNDSNNRVMQRPQLRCTDGGKASLKIGQKIPYVSGSLNSAVATPGAIPYATTQFQQVDVGTNIDLQPHVNGADEVSMHVKVEISNVINFQNIAGIQEPVIGQQVDEAEIRMKDGEVSILGGLNDKELSSTLAGVPGFANIPLLGYLFGTKTRTNTDNQILLALIPHIIRAPDMTHLADAGVLAGTEHVTRVEYRPEGTPVTPSATGPVTPSAVPPPVPATPLTPVPGGRPQPPVTRPPEATSQIAPNGQPANVPVQAQAAAAPAGPHNATKP